MTKETMLAPTPWRRETGGAPGGHSPRSTGAPMTLWHILSTYGCSLAPEAMHWATGGELPDPEESLLEAVMGLLERGRG